MQFIITATRYRNGEVVAFCKLSNSTKVGVNGYVAVSLSTMFKLQDAIGSDKEFRLSSNQDVTTVFFQSSDSLPRARNLSKEIITTSWFEEFGPVRNQNQHSLCWAYVALDLLSAHTVI
ncbi:unnamed protein product [Arabis nemorensis]|uniref:Uncharacterized protein n=1 Tax=Arabis nemorensis TaxID=586526 RepID=A0A565BSC0_9BRAS|nr:unnamed protein product [Arabis nemorensis]